MIAQGDGGVILFFGGEGDPPRGFKLGSLQTGFQAVEAMRRQLAVELGEYGIRTVSLRTGGVPEIDPGGLRGPRRDRREPGRVHAHRHGGDARGRRPRRGVRRLRPRADDDGGHGQRQRGCVASTEYRIRRHAFSGGRPRVNGSCRPSRRASRSSRGQVKAFAQEHGVRADEVVDLDAGGHRGGHQLRPARLHRA